MVNRCVNVLLLLIMTVTFVFALGCDDPDEEKLVVGVTIVPQATFVKKVCGDDVDVVIMVPTGSSPETFEPKPKDMVRLDKALIYFTIGVPSEDSDQLRGLLEKKKVVHLESVCKKVHGDNYLPNSTGRDPHIWLSPKRVITMVETIRDEMILLDPLNQDKYRENAKAYINELTKLDIQIKECLEASHIKEFIAFHPAFGYLASDYKLTQHSLEENGKEATIEHLTRMVDLAKEKNIKVIFYQEEIDSTQAQTFADEINGKAVKLEPLASDYVENLLNMVKVIGEIDNE